MADKIVNNDEVLKAEIFAEISAARLKSRHFFLSDAGDTVNVLKSNRFREMDFRRKFRWELRPLPPLSRRGRLFFEA